MVDYTAKIRGYMHVSIALFENKISFGEDPVQYHLGESLLNFVYSDLASLRNRAGYSPEDFSQVHPYFMLCDTLWRDSFLKNLISGEDSFFPDIETLIGLQKSYEALLRDLYQKNGTIDEKHISELMSKSDILRQNQCIYRMKLMDNGDVDYFVSSLEECLMLEFVEVLRRKVILKVCKNCQRLFVARRSNMDYCLRPYTPDGRTCAEVGYTQTFAKNVKNDELLLAYTRAYKAHYARMTKPRKKTANLTREEFEAWYTEAKHKLELARAGVLDAEVFKAWLKI